MKVGVLGAGAVGSMFGGLLKHRAPEIDVVFVGRGEHAKIIAERSAVRLECPWGSFHVPVQMACDASALVGCDFVLLTVKSHAAEDALRAAAPHLGQAVVVSVQNGLNDEVLRRFVPEERLVAGMTATNIAILQPGAASLLLNGVTILGSPDGPRGSAAMRAAELLRRTGLWIEESDQMRGVRYNKLAMNALGYASCISRSNFITEAVAWRSWRRTVGLPLVRECLEIYGRAGVMPAPIPGRPDPAKLRRLLWLFDLPVVGAAVALSTRRIYNRKPIVFSLAQDLLLGRLTEVEYINGEIVRLARNCGVDAPFNALVCELVHRLESSGPGSFLSREEVVREFRARGS